MEIWRPANGLEGRYDVSNYGRVRNHLTGRIRKPQKNNRGYLVLKITLPDEVVQKTRTVHSLVAETFIGPRPHGGQVNHKDCAKTNNLAANLEWVTALQNVQHAAENGLLPDRAGGHGKPQTGSLNYNAKLTESQATEIIKRLVAGDGVKPVARAFGVSHTLVRAIKTRKRWAHIPWG